MVRRGVQSSLGVEERGLHETPSHESERLGAVTPATFAHVLLVPHVVDLRDPHQKDLDGPRDPPLLLLERPDGGANDLPVKTGLLAGLFERGLLRRVSRLDDPLGKSPVSTAGGGDKTEGRGALCVAKGNGTGLPGDRHRVGYSMLMTPHKTRSLAVATVVTLTAATFVPVGDTDLIGMRGRTLVSAQTLSGAATACAALIDFRSLTITSARVVESESTGVSYCYVRGILPPAIGFHVQLPFPENWNGRFLTWGDGGKDGDLDFSDRRMAEGYAVANSNGGHDNGAEPGSSFGWNNRQAEIDFGYRAVHLTTAAGKTLTRAYYGEAPEYSYFEGCSTGGRQGLMEAQRYPDDFDGIVAGAPVNYYQALNASRMWLMQKVYANDLEASLTFDTDDDGRPDSDRKLVMLAETVMAACDTNDGISDGVINDPSSCDFDPGRDLVEMRCIDDVDGDECFTRTQLALVEELYAGTYDSQGTLIYPGKPRGSELGWMTRLFPHPRNRFRPGNFSIAGDHLNYIFYETDPGITLPDLTDTSVTPAKDRNPPEWSWQEFDIDDMTNGKGDLMMSIMDATDPDLTRFSRHGGKLLLYHGWNDVMTVAPATVDYYEEMVDVTFDGNMDTAREQVRLFLAPGMGHCRGGNAPDTWDRLAPLVAWVENGTAPDAIVATHVTDGTVDNERPLCPYPEQAVYTGPTGGENDPANWVASNFSCQ